ncbi:MAG: hypothetical protein IAF02_14950 [Anaerolineae bacterium]|nr:hypothetical protein [Anaerolineae bacterium]
MSNKISSFYFLRAKLHPPVLPEDHVLRPRLFAQLEKIKHQQIALVTAPAGYGKTTLVSAWVEQVHCPSVWISLDDGDNDLSVFLGYFISGLQSIFPDFGEGMETYSQISLLPSLPIISNYLIHEIDKIEQDFVLVLDDFHLLTNRDIHILLDGLLHYSLPHFHLVLTSRYDLPPQLSKLRAQGRMMELRANDLRFSAAEVTCFTDKSLPITPDAETIRILTEKTEGWAVGLRLATIALRRWGLDDYQPAILQVDNQYVVDYLVNEVLARCPTAVNDFLLKSSILDRFCTSLCAALMGTEPLDPMILPKLEREGLFIESLDTHKEWFRYHKLFQELLRRRLEEQFSPAEVATLHLRASVWLAANGFIEDAIDQALLGGDTQAAASILSADGVTLVNQERWLLLERLLNKFPPAVINEDLRLLLLLAWLSLSRMGYARVETFQKHLEKYLEADSLTLEERRFLNCSFHTFSAIKFNWAADYEKVIYHVQQALTTVEPEWGVLYGYLWIHLGTAAHQQKGGDAGLIVLKDDDHLMKDVSIGVRKQVAIAFVDWLSGDLPKLVHTAQTGLELVEALNLPTTRSMLCYLAGSALYERNDFELAEQYFRTVLDLKHGFQLQAFVFSAIGQALIYQARNMVDEAWEMSETAVNFCLDTDHPSLLFIARAFQADLAARQGQLEKAILWVNQTDVTALSKLMPYLYQPQLTPAKIWLIEGTPDSLRKAEAELLRLQDIVISTHNIPCQIKVMALQVLLYKSQKKTRLAEETLVQAILLAQPGGFIRAFADLGPQMAVLLKQLYVQGFASAYIQRVLKAFPAAARPLPPVAQSQALIESLTERELEILGLLAQRLSNKEIANALVISKETVKRHTSNIYQKLGVKNRRQAVASGYTLGLLVGVLDPTD